MTNPLDIRTLLVVFALIRILQAIGLVYVWHIHRKYDPARNWAIGSALIAAGTLLIVLQGEPSMNWGIIPGNICALTGILVFNFGIAQTCAGRVPWRAGAIFVCGAMLGQAWFTIWSPSVAGRTVILTAVIVVCKGYAAACALRAPRGVSRGTLRLIAALLVTEASISVIACIAGVEIEVMSILQSAAPQVFFTLSITATAVLLAVALAILTSQRMTALLEATLNHMNHGVAMFDREQRLINCNDRYGQIYGLTSEQVSPGTTLAEIVSSRLANGIYAGETPDEYRQTTLVPVIEPSQIVRDLSDGRRIAIARRPMEGGGWVTTHEDITDRHRTEAKIAFMAHHDLLTGLANRAFFLEKIEEAGARLRRSGDAFAVFMLDLDRFKNVNDSLGHPAGDALLRETARRLKASLREADTLARIGGDEFAIIQLGVAGQREGTTTLANRIVDIISKTYDLDGTRVSIGTSIGIAFAPKDGSNPSELMKNADLALYKAKSKGRNGYCFFDAEMAADLIARQELENDFRSALQRREFELHYQPIIDARTRAPRGMEALVRWCHPRQGVIPPDRFIALAEETGLIVPLGEWVLHRACADATSWPAYVKVAVNLSPLQFRNGNLLDIIAGTLAELRLPPERLEVEVTETVLLENDTEHLAVMHRLKDIGVSIALDDFGTGYSSLGYLTTFPFSKIKIDRSFTRNLTKRPECAAIVSSVVALAAGLNMTTVAEGVESVEQYEFLRAAGVHLVQGFLFGEPKPVSELEFNRMDTLGRPGEGSSGRQKGLMAQSAALSKAIAS